MEQPSQQPAVPSHPDSAAQRAAQSSVFPMPASFQQPVSANSEAEEAASQPVSSSVFPMPAGLFGGAAPAPESIAAPSSAPVGPTYAPVEAPVVAPPSPIPAGLDLPKPPVEERDLPPPIQTASAAVAGGWLLTWLQAAGSCTLSIALHGVALATLATWTILFPADEQVIPVWASLGEHEDVELATLEELEPVEAVEIDVQEMPDTPQAVFDKVVEHPDDAAAGDIADNIGFDGLLGDLGNMDGLFGKVGGGLAGDGTGGGMKEFARRLKREGGMSGEVQFTLIWEGYNDLDLHVLTPAGVEISWQNRTDKLGKLDVDMNADRMSKEPVENVFWPAGRAPRGKYMVGVHHFASRGGPRSVNFQVAVKVDGKVETIKGVAVLGAPMQVVHTLER